MDALNTILQGLVNHPGAMLAALALVALAYVYRERSEAQKDLVDTVLRQEAAHRETLTKIVPISEKLIDSVEALERVTDALLKRGS